MSLTRAIHTLRIFTCHSRGAVVANEVLLDGHPWPTGEPIISGAAPPATPERIGARLFALLIPT